jgi:hypothetical protein
VVAGPPGTRLPMITLTIASVLVGALLGMRFRVFILVPAVLLGVAIVTGVGIARESGIWWVAFEIVVITTALEVGYLGGSVAVRIWSRSSNVPVRGREDEAADNPTENEASQSRNGEAGQGLGKVTQPQGSGRAARS